MFEANSLFDVIFTIEAMASAAIVVAVLAFAVSGTMGGRVRAAIAFSVWLTAVIVAGATGILGNEHGLGTPGLGIAVALPIAVLSFVFLKLPGARAALSRIPLWVPIAVNGLRVLGFSFLVLYSAHQLPAPFAPAAGWGDILVGATALPIAWIAARFGARANRLILVWNILGTLDLVVAIGLGATSAPGPIQIFTQFPSSALMTTLPWILIPCFLVPAFQSLHIAIFYRIKAVTSQAQTHAELAF